MTDLNDRGWKCLERINAGDVKADLYSASMRTLLFANEFIVNRREQTVAITGKGREALIRRKYQLSLSNLP